MAKSHYHNQKVAAGAWDFVQTAMTDTAWNSRWNDYNLYDDYYRGRYWPHETSKIKKAYIWRLVINVLREVVDEYVAYISALKLRPWHMNPNPNLNDVQKVLNRHLERHDRLQFDKARTNMGKWGAQHGAGIMRIGMDIDAMTPSGPMPMPTYRGDQAWKWMWDPNAELIEDANWAIRFALGTRSRLEKLARREIASDSQLHYNLKEAFESRLSPTAKHRNEGQGTTTASEARVVGFSLWHRNTEISDVVKSDDNWKLLTVGGGDYTMYEGPHPWGTDFGIPAAIYTPAPIAGYLYGQSLIQLGKDIQRDHNFRLSSIREIEQEMRGVLNVPGGPAVADRVRAQRRTGVISTGGSAVHLRGEKPDAMMYQALWATRNEFREKFGLPPVAMGESQTGVYSAKQTGMLQQAAGIKMVESIESFSNALKRIGELRWKLLQRHWRADRVLDIGDKQAIISGEVFAQRGWGTDVATDYEYMAKDARDMQQIEALYAAGYLPDEVYFNRVTFLSPEEKQASLARLAQLREAAMAAQSQEAAPTPARQTA